MSASDDESRAAKEAGAPSDDVEGVSYRDELRRGFCWRCFFFSLLPLLLLLGFLWWGASAWLQSREELATQRAAFTEATDDYDESSANLEAQLAARDAELAEARLALLGGEADSPAVIGAKLAALPEDQREPILLRYGHASGATLEPSAKAAIGAIDALPEDEQTMLFGEMPALESFAGWFSGLPKSEQQGWMARLPGDGAALEGADGADASIASAGSEALQAAEAQIAELQGRVAALAAERDAARDAAEDALARAKTAETALAAAGDARLTAETEAELEREARLAAEAELKALYAKQSAPTAETPASPENEELTAQAVILATAIEERDRLTAALQAITAERDALAAQLLALREAREEDAQTRDMLQVELEAAKVDQASAATEIEALTAARDAAIETAQALDADVEEASAQLAARAAEQQALTAERDALTAQLEATQQALTEAETVLGERTAEIAALTVERDEANKAAGELAKARLVGLAEAQEQIDSLTAALAATETERDALRASASGAAEENAAAAAAALGALEAKLSDLEAALRNAETTAEAARQAALDADRRAKEAETRAQAANERAAASERARIAAEDARAVAEANVAAAQAAGPDFEPLRGRVSDGLQGPEEEDPALFGRLSLAANVAFETSKATLSRDGQAALDRIAAVLIDDLRRNPDSPWLLVIEGHTDRRPISTAAFPSNWELSTARAAAVARYLVAQGVPAERIIAAGRAAYDPVDPADTPEAHRLNRRIEFKITEL